MGYFIGTVLALAVGVFGTRIGLDRDRAFYPTVMIVIAAYYVLFSLIGGSTQALLTECGVAAPFIVASTVGFKRSLWLVVAALAAHGTLDFVHPHLVSNPGVPVWWPDFCLAYDVVAAGYLAVLLNMRSAPAREMVSVSYSPRAPRSGASTLPQRGEFHPVRARTIP